ncbi:trans-sialidase [Trypanosoma rangeli]|uniref:Trans-sialidase n=1 Tax=Trypanosoma rangeli TaxID=5698 RepID=A0A3R7M8T8_TRYRA|nr:trans-sialidase [Trypanosoma rangeli]RNF01520.1 trans-sialidase [Trypanosoma rangeli]|eukprot:RNF01520.1 trans-sialidase [Trypanosoma rangeli]
MQLKETSDASGSNAAEITQRTAMVVERDVYMLLGSYSCRRSESELSGKKGWKLLLVNETVSGENGVTNLIQWGETHAVKVESETHAFLTRLVGSRESILVLSDSTLVFPMQATDNE